MCVLMCTKSFRKFILLGLRLCPSQAGTGPSPSVEGEALQCPHLFLPTVGISPLASASVIVPRKRLISSHPNFNVHVFCD